MLEIRPLVGWSDVANSPEILETILKNKKSAMGCTWFLTLLFPVGFVLAGFLSDEMPFNEGLIIGVTLGLLMLVVNLWRIKDMKKLVWEGVVIEKLEKKRYKHDHDNGSTESHMEYMVLIITESGKKKRIIERKWNRDMYDYLAVGDRVRYHPALETYEKYDKSRDKIIYCNVCRQRNSITNDRCDRCNSLLFK